MRFMSLSLLLVLAGCGDPDADADAYTESVDCDDTNPAINPGATEVPYDGIDNDCSAATRDDDLDLDGFASDVDCDDDNDKVYPGAAELCDGLDNDCDEQVDVGAGTTYYRDADGDGYGDPGTAERHCAITAGWITTGTDCDDTSADVFPGADEVCNGEDDDCNGFVDDDPTDVSPYFIDYDGDGFGSDAYTLASCEDPGAGWVMSDTDCLDTNASAFPGGAEVCDGLDNDCSGVVDDNITATEVCDGVDNDCDGTVDIGATDAPTWYLDYDKDGLGDSNRTVTACTAPSSDYVSVGGDPDDTTPQ